MVEARDTFIDYGERYQVDPRAVAGSIAAENTMNVQASDLVQSWLAHRGITGIGSKKFSFGFGQINMPAALEAETHLAKIDGRPERSAAEIREALLTMDGSIYYATGIVRKAQDDYKAKGIDISKRPEILATLYNLGQTEQRALAASTSRKSPQVNYFGYFVENNLNDIGSLLGWDAVSGTRTKPRVSEELSRESGSFETNRSGVTLLTAPPTCSLDGRAEAGRYTKIMSARDFAAVGTVTGRFKVVGRGVDCDLNDYIRVEFQNGKQGWMRTSLLQDQDSGIKASSDSSTPTCSKSEGDACLEKLKRLLNSSSGIQKVSLSAENKIFLDLVTTDGKPLTDSYKTSNIVTCAEYAGGGGIVYMSGGSSSNPQPTTAETVDKVLAKTRQIKSEIVERLALNGWSDPDNPVNNLFDERKLEECKQNLKTCDISITLISRQFNGTADDVDKFLKLNTKSMDTRDLLVLLKGSQFWVQRAQPSNRNSDYQSFSNERQTAARDTFKECQSILEQTNSTSSLTKVIESLNSIDDKTYPNYSWDAQGWLRQLKDFGQKCKALKTVLANRYPKEMDQIELDVSDGTSRAPMKIATIKKIQPGEKSLKDGFKMALGNFESNLTQYFSSAARMSSETTNCTYDPFETTNLVQKLANEPCVEQIYVPDIFVLVALRSANTTKIVLDESDEMHLGVRLKGCAQKQNRGRIRIGDPSVDGVVR